MWARDRLRTFVRVRLGSQLPLSDRRGRPACREQDGLHRDHCRLVAKLVSIMPHDSINDTIRVDAAALLHLLDDWTAVDQPTREHGKICDALLCLQDGRANSGEAGINERILDRFETICERHALEL